MYLKSQDKMAELE